MIKRFGLYCLVLWLGLGYPHQLWSAESTQSNVHDPIAKVIFWVTLIFALAILGRAIAKRLHQPGVLGELIIGIIFGNICYFLNIDLFIIVREGGAVFNIMQSVINGLALPEAIAQNIPDPRYAQEILTVLQQPAGLDLIKIGYILDILSRYGVIFLLFMVGLESSFEELKQVGKEAFKVAFIGVIMPIILGYATAFWLLPHASFNTALFVAATLSATSIGITARVLTEMKQLHTREAKTILGAAMLDDVLGLIILAVVSSIVVNGQLNWLMMIQVTISALLFFVGVVLLGPWILRLTVKQFRLFEAWEAKLFVSFLFVMLMSWVATLIGLASIIGAFAAGLVIHDGFFSEETHKPGSFGIKELVAPLEAILAPLFFMLIGIQVKLEAFLDWHVLFAAGALTLAAILGKIVSGIGAHKKDDRLLVGIGMMPRGEVGLVFASIGRTLGVISDQIFSAIILMVIITTLLAPPLLKIRFQQHHKESATI